MATLKSFEELKQAISGDFMRDRVLDQYISALDYPNFRQRCNDVEEDYQAKTGKVVAMRYSFTMRDSSVTGEVNITMHMHNDNTGDHAGDIELRGYGDGYITLAQLPWHNAKKEKHIGILAPTVQKIVTKLRVHLDDEVQVELTAFSAMINRMVHQYREMKFSYDVELKERSIVFVTYTNGNIRGRNEIFVTKLEELVPA